MNSILALKISETTTVEAMTQLWRFLSLADQSVQLALIGAILLGVSCGLLGGYLTVRNQALTGDMVAHATLPGIVIAFMVTLSKNPVYLLMGATLTGVLSVWFFDRLRRTRELKADSVMGITLVSFYAVGIGLLTMIQNIPNANQAGLDKFLFGQASALSIYDIYLMLGATILSIGVIWCFYKELLLVVFDGQYARICGLRVEIFNGLLIFLTAVTIVISIKAVGIVLVSALLIIPASTAGLITYKFGKLLMLSVFFGVLAGVMGTMTSFLGHSLPTGPFIVVYAAGFFVMVFLFKKFRTR